MKILIREANWLGDAVLTIPSITALSSHFQDAKITIAAKESILPLFNLLEGEISLFPLGGIKSLLMLRKEKFDLAVIFPNSFRSALEVFLTRAHTRLGYAASGRSIFLTERVSLKKNKTHQADYYYHLLNPLGIKGAKPVIKLRVKEKDKEFVLNRLKEKGVDVEKPLIVISPGASYGEAKCWPEGNFAALTKRLSKQAEIIFIGTKKDAPVIDKIISICDTSLAKSPANLAGKTSLTQLAALFSVSKAVISNDNGAMHLASAGGAPVICLFGPTDPFRTGPLGQNTIVLQDKVDCSPCTKRICPDKKCFSNITVDRVSEAVKNFL